MKAYQKLNIIIGCQIVARKSVAPVDKIRNSEEKCFSKIIITPLLRLPPDFREYVASMIFNGYLFFLLGGLGGRVPNQKSHYNFFLFFQKIFFLKHHGDL